MRRLLAIVPCLVLSVSGCFGRTGLEGLEGAGIALDGSTDGVTVDDAIPSDDGSVTDSSVPGEDAPVSTDSGPTKDTGIDIFDVIPIPEGGVIGDCAGCVRDNCGDAVNKCVNDAKCRAGLACAATKCLAGGGGGGLDFGCITDCFGGDFSSAATAISAFTCVTSKCGEKCGGLLGAIPGLPGGGGGGGVPETWSAEQVMSVDRSTRIVFASEALSPWSTEISAEAAKQAGCAP